MSELKGAVIHTEHGPAVVVGLWPLNEQYVEIEYTDGSGTRSVRRAAQVRELHHGDRD